MSTATFIANLKKLYPRVEDLRPVLPRHASDRYPTRSLSQITRYAYHHTGPGSTRRSAWASIARYHITLDPSRTPPKEAWPGIGYHVGVQTRADGVWISILNPLEWVTWNVADGNTPTVGIVVMGNLVAGKDGQPTAAELEALRIVTRALDDTLRRKPLLGPHKAFVPPLHTECPGLLTSHVSTLRQAPAPVPAPTPAPVAPVDELAKLAKGAQVISPNWGAAIAKAADEAGYTTPLGNELTLKEWVFQLWAAQGKQEAIFYVKSGDWGNVKFKVI